VVGSLNWRSGSDAKSKCNKVAAVTVEKGKKERSPVIRVTIRSSRSGKRDTWKQSQQPLALRLLRLQGLAAVGTVVAEEHRPALEDRVVFLLDMVKVVVKQRLARVPVVATRLRSSSSSISPRWSTDGSPIALLGLEPEPLAVTSSSNVKQVPKSTATTEATKANVNPVVTVGLQVENRERMNKTLRKMRKEAEVVQDMRVSQRLWHCWTTHSVRLRCRDSARSFGRGS
jgi:hypothetical protein